MNAEAARAGLVAWCLVAWCLVGALALGCAGRQHRRDPVVKDLAIEGNHALSDRQIAKKIQTTETGWWPFATKHFFDPITWQTDLKRIVRLYGTRGFYDAKIAAQDAVPDPPDGVRLKVKVEEGEVTVVDGVETTGLEDLPAADREAALAAVPLVVGRPFHEADWEAAKGGIAHELRQRGYAQAEVIGEALIDVGSHRAKLRLRARPGPLYTFGAIEVDPGPDAVLPAFWVWEQARLALGEGERFSDDAIEEARRRITALGVFAAVKVTSGTPDPASGRISVRVETREAPFRTLKAGVGVRIDQIRNEARLVSEWTHRNFLGGLRRLTAHAEAGWAFIPNTYAVLRNQQPETGTLRNGPIARLRLEFEQPRFLGRPSLRERSSLELSRTLEFSYDALGGALVNGVIWRPRASLTIFPAHHLEAYSLNGPSTASAFSAPLTLGCKTSDASCFIWLSYLEEIVTWDRRDNALEPHRGFYASLSLQQGGGPLLGDFSYWRVLPDVRGYVSFGDDDELTLAGRLRVGELLPTSGRPDDSAVVTRFYAGGGVSMRGFNDRRLSPLLRAQPPATAVNPMPATSTLPIGGNGMIDGSFEVRYAITESLVLAAFVDFGQVTRNRVGPGDVAHLLYAVGLGVRYRTPIGPIRLDFARRLQIGRPPPLLVIDDDGVIRDQPYDVDDSCFGLGGSGRTTDVKDNLCVLHISIGEAY